MRLHGIPFEATDWSAVAASEHPGDKATWAAVYEDLTTLPMLAPKDTVSMAMTMTT